MAKDKKPGNPIIERAFGRPSNRATVNAAGAWSTGRVPFLNTKQDTALVNTTYAAYQTAITTAKAKKTAYEGAYTGAGIAGFLQPYTYDRKVWKVDKTSTLFTFYPAGGDILLPATYPVGTKAWVWATGSSLDGQYVATSFEIDGVYQFNVTQSTANSSSFTGKKITGFIGIGGTGQGEYADVYKKYKAWKAAEKDVKEKKAVWEAAKNGKDITKGSGTSTPPPGKTADFPDPTTPTTYNLPSLSSSYFRSDEYYSKNVLLGAGGRPIPVHSAESLWNDPNASHKGMIQVWKYNTMLSSKEASNTNEANWLVGNSLYPTKKRYGFQFMYNPGSVTQQWSGLPNINVSYVMSGKDKTPYVAPIETSSSLSFAIPINRVNDMALLSSRGVANVAAQSSSLGYYGQSVDASELQVIRNRGTMYDVEYLLKTLVGFEVYSELRGYKTADIGWLLGYAIELHLGKDLRYIGTISYIEVQHTIFNNEMIPVYSTLTITVTRRVEPVVGASTRVGGSGSTGRNNTSI
jgi:hypothetical protein